MDYGLKAAKARKEYCDGGGPAENELEHRIQEGLNWGIISQQHATTLGHVDTAGVYTAVVILTGVKLWAIRKTALEGRTEKDVDVVDYFVDLADRDLESLPGGATNWLPIILFPGDIL